MIAAMVLGFDPWSWTTSKLTNPKHVMTLIFIPVVTTFALSISIIFLSLISNQSNIQWVGSQGVFGALGMSEVEETGSDDDVSMRCIRSEIIWNQICFNYPRETIGSMLDLIGWLLVNVFGIAFMWTVVFAALKTSKITEWTVNSIRWTAEWFMQAAPVVSTPAWMQSIWSLWKAKSHLEGVPERMHGERFSEEIEPFMNRMSSRMTWEVSEVDDNMERAIDEGNVGGSQVADLFRNKAEWTTIRDYDNALGLMRESLNNEYGADISSDADWDDVMATTEFDDFLDDVGVDESEWVSDYMSQSWAHGAE